jgi:two-component system sensor histidine kinase ChvG
MASDTNTTINDFSDLDLSWSGRWTLTYRILAVNILTLVLLALSE